MRCDTKTNVRKLPLVIHVEGVGLVLLAKTCRLCLRCDTLVAHKAELDELIRVAGRGSPARSYVVLGTLDRRTLRQGLSGRTFARRCEGSPGGFQVWYWKVDVTPAGWYPKNQSAG